MIKDKKQLIKDILKRKIITEQEVLLIRRRLNHGVYNWDDVEVLQNLKITPEQTNKGLTWLKNKGWTPRGIERKNSPFGYREEDAIETFKEFRLDSFTNRNNYFQQENNIFNWLPVWNVIGKKNSFQYIVENETASIIG